MEMALGAVTIIASLLLVNIDPRDSDFTLALVLASRNLILAGYEHQLVVWANWTLRIANDLYRSEASLKTAGESGMLPHIERMIDILLEGTAETEK